MKNTWHNNRISEKLNKEYSRDFSICDIDGVVRCHYKVNGKTKTRLIIYESKNKNEKKMGKSQLLSLNHLNDSIDWPKFDNYSGLFVIVINDLIKDLRWYDLKGNLKLITNFDELYNIFSGKLK